MQQQLQWSHTSVHLYCSRSIHNWGRENRERKRERGEEREELADRVPVTRPAEQEYTTNLYCLFHIYVSDRVTFNTLDVFILLGSATAAAAQQLRMAY